ncbi:hypothetical protein RIF29_14664 [Crotalaria pallida]|uniref:Uncharacterized protein n=1 Tax=Crotalaria pallida TaxID=3830 RepID=A0AAN9IAH9_CROPI
MVDGGGAVRLTTQPESFIEPSTTHQGESSACRLGVVKDKNISTASDVWETNVEGFMMYQVSRKLQLLKSPLKGLNKRSFSDIDKKEVELKDHLLGVQSQLVLNPLDVLL